MKPTTASGGEIASPARVEFAVKFSHGPKGRRRVREAPVEVTPRKAADPAPEPVVVASTEPIPKITRLLVLAYHFERLLREGAVKDYAEIAPLTGLTRARVTQITNLLLLAPEIQEAILNLIGDSRITERHLRSVAALVEWQRQREMWQSMLASLADGVPRHARCVRPR